MTTARRKQTKCDQPFQHHAFHLSFDTFWHVYTETRSPPVINKHTNATDGWSQASPLLIGILFGFIGTGSVMRPDRDEQIYASPGSLVPRNWLSAQQLTPTNCPARTALFQELPNLDVTATICNHHNKPVGHHLKARCWFILYWPLTTI